MFDSSVKVLVVDDMKTMRKLVMNACKKIGFSNFVEAADGNEAWAAVEQNNGVQLVISDWNMPNCTGLEFLRKVRGSAQHKSLPFLMLTAESEASQVTECIQAGVDNYLVKPFNVDGLKQKLELVYKKTNAA